MASRAGSSVIDVSMVASTVTDTPIPMPESHPEADEQQPEHRDDDGGAGEDDGTAGGAHGDHGGVPAARGPARTASR